MKLSIHLYECVEILPSLRHTSSWPEHRDSFTSSPFYKCSSVQVYTDIWNWFCVTVAYLHKSISRTHLLPDDKVAPSFRSVFRKQKLPTAANSYLKDGQQNGTLLLFPAEEVTGHRTTTSQGISALSKSCTSQEYTFFPLWKAPAIKWCQLMIEKKNPEAYMIILM